MPITLAASCLLRCLQMCVIDTRLAALMKDGCVADTKGVEQAASRCKGLW